MQFCAKRSRGLQTVLETRRAEEPYVLKVINYLDRHLSRFYISYHECLCIARFWRQQRKVADVWLVRGHFSRRQWPKSNRNAHSFPSLQRFVFFYSVSPSILYSVYKLILRESSSILEIIYLLKLSTLCLEFRIINGFIDSLTLRNMGSLSHQRYFYCKFSDR